MYVIQGLYSARDGGQDLRDSRDSENSVRFMALHTLFSAPLDTVSAAQSKVVGYHIFGWGADTDAGQFQSTLWYSLCRNLARLGGLYLNNSRQPAAHVSCLYPENEQ